MKILHLEDNPRDVTLVQDLLTAEWPDCFISVVATRADFVSHLRLGGFDLILSDYQLPGFDGLEALDLARQLAPEVPFVFCSGTLGEERAIAAVRSGAADFVVKDRMSHLPIAVRRVLREADELRRRRRVEDALAKEQALLRLLMENLPAHVYFKDLQSAFIAVSRSKARSHGFEPEQLKGKSDFEVFGDAHARRAFEDEQRIIRTGEALVDLEEKVVWPDGRVTWMSATKLPLRDEAGRIIGTFGISHDITARKEAEERIREQAEIIDHAPVAIIVTDLANVVTYANPAAFALFGTSRAEAVGRPADAALSAETVAQVEQARREVAAHGSWTGVIPVTTASGRQFQAEFHMSVIRDEAGAPRARLSIAIDVTEKKKLEEQFLRAQRLESVGLLAAGIAHDLNNVLSPILMSVPLLHTRAMNPADLQVLEAIESSATRGAALVRQILSFSHGAGGGQVLVQTRHLLEEVAKLVRQTFPKSIRLEAGVPGGLRPVRGNPTQLHQVLLNLCVNARDAMPDGGELRLRAENWTIDAVQAGRQPGAHPGEYLMIEVADTGTGIAPEIQARIWEPFFTTKGEGKGTGLGLATVRGIAASHNGFVTLDSAPGRGTTFRVFLPAAEPVVAPGAGGNPSPAPLARGQGELVLVVDDEPNVRELITAILGRFGYRVLAAEDGTAAMALFAPRAEEFALVVTDLGMPGMSGAKLAQALGHLRPGVPLLFISGGSVPGRIEPPPPGALVLNKPFTGEELLQQVRLALGPATVG